MKSKFTLALISVLFCNLSPGQWTTGGPYGGSITKQIMIGSDVYVAIDGSGIFKSSDSCKTWQSRSNGLSRSSINLVAYDGTYLYAGAGTNDKVYRSPDFGLNWTRVTNAPVDLFDLCGVNNVVYAGGVSALFKSTNGGISWDTCYSPGMGSNFYAYHITAHGNEVYFSGRALAKSGNGYLHIALRYHTLTQKFDTLFSTDFGYNYGFNDWAFSGDTIMTSGVLCGGTLPFGVFGILISKNNGATWDSIYSPYKKQVVIGKIAWDGTTILTTSGNNYSGACRFNFATSTIDSVNVGIVYDYSQSYTIFSVGTDVFLSLNANLYKTSNHGNTWTQLQCTGMSSIPMTSVFAISSSQVYAGSYQGVVYRSSDKGQTWTFNPNTFKVPVNDIHYFNNSLYASTNGGGIFKSADNGATWTFLTLSGSYVGRFTDDGTDIYVGADAGFEKSTNGGTSYVQFRNGLPATAGALDQVIMGNSIYACVISGGFNEEGIYKSSKTTANFTRLANGWPQSNPLSIVRQGTTLFVGTGNYGVYYSTDSGNTWVANNTGIANRVVYHLISLGNDLVAATDSGVYFLHNSTGTWLNISFNLPSSDTRALSAANGTLYVAVNGGSVWEIPLSMVGIKESKVKPALINIYPNPANDQVTVSGVPFSEGDELNIFDITGRIVEKSIISANTSHNIILRLENFKNGIYFIQFIPVSGIKTEFTQKLIIQH